MKKIPGFTPAETLEYLRAYLAATQPMLTWDRHPICTFILMRYISRRTNVFTFQERDEMKKAIWAFVAYWYNKLGYILPVDANEGTKLFEYLRHNTLEEKISARKEFIRKVIAEISESKTVTLTNDFLGIKNLFDSLSIRK